MDNFDNLVTPIFFLVSAGNSKLPPALRYLSLSSRSNLWIVYYSIYIVQYFDRGNIDGFGTKLAIHQNFLFQYFAVV